MSDIVLYDNKYDLEPYEVLFIESFKDTHSLNKSMKHLTKTQKSKVNATLRGGTRDLAVVFKDFIEEAPIHPEANKVVILDNLVWIMKQAKEDKDTQGVLRAITEINKMIKGNLASSTDKTIVEKHLVGIIDLTKKDETKGQETVTIDV